MTTAVRWNVGKPHRCPECHAVAIDMEAPKSWRIYTCCRCATRFTRWPTLAFVLPHTGVRCTEHHTPKES
ncbi:hypothetical protein ACFVG1_12795 [Streptomyces bacillaris]|uniref:hypothetical protein n=1 Tax=Streptomyces bacillaris TaxID=68179 RepID=UPI0035D952AF